MRRDLGGFIYPFFLYSCFLILLFFLSAGTDQLHLGHPNSPSLLFNSVQQTKGKRTKLIFAALDVFFTFQVIAYLFQTFSTIFDSLDEVERGKKQHSQ
ncbi:hypothetical protein IWX49DRAFT_344887 [Phyllosticta citricarpa]|uniref:Uncharacterized protein n=1 Tax=Phyllosticta citricarpa TaxID=55181 RepID=A0ABR1MUX4_9PEZI